MADDPPVPGWWQEYAEEFPGWQVWRATDGLLYARKTGLQPAPTVRGEDAVDLRDQIIRAESQAEG
jgi:hypothetical protein